MKPDTHSPSEGADDVAPAVEEPLIKIKELSKAYGDHVALDSVSVDVQRGEILALVGPSGAGKSTLLRCINLLEQPDTGSLTVTGTTVDFSRPVRKGAVSAIRESTGMVFQDFNLFPHLTVLKNVSLAQQRVLGRKSHEADERSMSLLHRVGLEDKANEFPNRCSGGQQQRVAIARALALDPQIMLFDEPTSALDPELGQEVLLVMRDLAQTGMTMVVVTHEMSFARQVGDWLIIMADGRILEQGEPRKILSGPSTERGQAFLAAVLER